jgi:type II secretory pathway pseudopilin PulG
MRLQIHLQPYSLKGLSIFEVMAVLVIVGAILSSVIPGCIDRINRAKYVKMINEMTSIAQASIDFYTSQYPYVWPTSTSQLAPAYMYQAVTLSPWGGNYELAFQNNLAEVSTTIPAGIAQKNPEGQILNVVNGPSGDQISIALSVPNAGIGRVQYEKKYRYNQ